MTRALRAFMAELIDYAGLFPPAALPLEAAVAEYGVHRCRPEAWLLGRFIAPAAALPALGAAREAAGAAGPAWGCSLLVGDRAGAEASLAVLAGQGELAAACEAGGIARIEALEYPLAGGVCRARPELKEHLAALRSGLADAGLGDRALFLELPAGGDDDLVLEVLAEPDPGGATARVGAKLRCGGLEPAAFPEVARVAEVLAACARGGVPLKCTAGLHHPVRHRAAEPPVMMHGFLNVFGAGFLAHAGALAGRDLEACVAETDPTAFAFTDEVFAWRDHRVPVATLRELRERALSGFGSCSITEPVADLQALGLLRAGPA